MVASTTSAIHVKRVQRWVAAAGTAARPLNNTRQRQGTKKKKPSVIHSDLNSANSWQVGTIGRVRGPNHHSPKTHQQPPLYSAAKKKKCRLCAQEEEGQKKRKKRNPPSDVINWISHFYYPQVYYCVPSCYLLLVFLGLSVGGHSTRRAAMRWVSLTMARLIHRRYPPHWSAGRKRGRHQLSIVWNTIHRTGQLYYAPIIATDTPQTRIFVASANISTCRTRSSAFTRPSCLWVRQIRQRYLSSS